MTSSATSSSLNIFVSITSLKNSRSFELLLPKPHKELPLQLTKHSNHKFSRSCCTSHTINSFYNFLTIQPVLRISKKSRSFVLSLHETNKKLSATSSTVCIRKYFSAIVDRAKKLQYFGYCLSMKLPLQFSLSPKVFRVVQKITHFCLTVVQAINRVYCFEICALSTSFFSRSTVKGLHRNNNAKVTHRL